MTPAVLRLAAFPVNGRGGNPAGVVLDASGLTDDAMKRIAHEVGYSETAFLWPLGPRRFRIRYFSPEAEVDFCGHATIATGVALAESLGTGAIALETNAGEVPIVVTDVRGAFSVALESRPGFVTSLDDSLLDELLTILGWGREVLAPGYVPMVANAGNDHPVIVLESPEVFEHLDYDFDALQGLCRANRWPTVQLVAAGSEGSWRSRNPFAFGGVYEDPATGSAAAAFAVYLRETGNAAVGDSFVIDQGFEMGQPCRLFVTVGAQGAQVSGGALRLEA